MKPEMVKTKFTRNGREVMIFGAMRNFDYGSDEAVQESKKGGERDASVSLSSPERSRIRKSVEGISMLASTEVSKASKTRRGTSYGSPASSPEKTTRRGTSYGSPSPVKATRRGSTLSPRVSKKQKVNVAPSGDDREEWPETEMLASTVAKKTRRGTSYGGSPVSPRQSKKQKGLHFGESQAQSSEAQTSQNQSSQAQASAWEVPQSSEGQSSQAQSSRWEVPQSSQAEASQTAAWGRCSSTTAALLRDTTNSHRIHRRILTTRTHHAILEEGEMRIEILKDEIEENRA
ncbi:hypothetical protein HID58_025859 [Brassica napus]|uniref:Uncharacterized protein n=1 Tax=Brassica napus TaxID=3708 RepID=A0ABQ8CMB3_BRANA|nr:hypothetical protein HID58_025859 [Brassica napus]